MPYPGSTKTVGGPVGFAGKTKGALPKVFLPLSAFFLQMQGEMDGDGGVPDGMTGYRKKSKKKDKRKQRRDARAKGGQDNQKAIDQTVAGSGEGQDSIGADKGSSTTGGAPKGSAATEASERSFKPPKAVQKAAKQGLEMRREHGRGGLSTQEAGKQGIGSGVQRASDLANGENVTLETVKKMRGFFARHEKNKGKAGDTSAGRIAWLLWGGDPGKTWVNGILSKMEEGVQTSALAEDDDECECDDDCDHEDCGCEAHDDEDDGLEEVVSKGVTMIMGGMKFRVTKTGSKVIDVVGVPGRSGQKVGHEGQKFYVYVKGYGDDRTFTLTPATSKGVPGFMASDDKKTFKRYDVTFLMPRSEMTVTGNIATTPVPIGGMLRRVTPTGRSKKKKTKKKRQEWADRLMAMAETSG